MKCRCGFNGTGDHPCHSNGYSCGKPAKHRFYNAKGVALTGLQMKVQMNDTYACDECWNIYLLRYERKQNETKT